MLRTETEVREALSAVYDARDNWKALMDDPYKAPEEKKLAADYYAQDRGKIIVLLWMLGKPSEADVTCNPNH